MVLSVLQSLETFIQSFSSSALLRSTLGSLWRGWSKGEGLFPQAGLTLAPRISLTLASHLHKCTQTLSDAAPW